MCQGMSRFNQNNKRNLKECQMDPAVVKIMQAESLRHLKAMRDVCNPANISCFPRRLEDVLKTSSAQHFSSSICNTFSSNVFKTSSRRVCKTSCNYVFKTSWKTKKCYTEDVLKTSSVRLHEGESLLGKYFFIVGFSICVASSVAALFHAIYMMQSMIQSKMF